MVLYPDWPADFAGKSVVHGYAETPNLQTVDDMQFKTEQFENVTPGDERRATRFVGNGSPMDMTPMVDVTFLLLIFFMVTASFVLGRAMNQMQPGMATAMEPDQAGVLEVLIDRDNMVMVRDEKGNSVDAGSDLELRAMVHDSAMRSGADRLRVVAHVDSLHSRAVAVCDAGLAAGIGKIECVSTEWDF